MLSNLFLLFLEDTNVATVTNIKKKLIDSIVGTGTSIYVIVNAIARLISLTKKFFFELRNVPNLNRNNLARRYFQNFSPIIFFLKSLC